MCVFSTQFYTGIRLECTSTVPYITGGQTERQLECSVLLVGIQTATFAYGKCLATEILMVAMVV